MSARPIAALIGAALAGMAAAAAGEGQAPSPPPDMTRLRVVYRVPGMDRVQVRRNVVYRTVGETRLELDVYSPPEAGAGARLPTVILVHGGPVPKAAPVKDLGVFVSYGELLAASGFTAVTFNHRLYQPELLAEAASDVKTAVEHVRGHSDQLGIDRERIAFWVFSGGGSFLSLPLRERWPFARALVAYYAVLDLQGPPPPAAGGPIDVLFSRFMAAITDETRRELSARHHLAAAGDKAPPLFVARAGRDNSWLNGTVDRFVQAAVAGNASLELMTHPSGQHAFDILDDDDRSREIIARTLGFLKYHLLRP